MSKITIKNDTAPDTPESGKTALYVDATTKKLHSLDDAGVDTEYGTGGGGGGSGDVVGPAVATDNAIARYDTTTGKLIQDSPIIIDDIGNVTGMGTLNTRNLATDSSKLDGIESGATADQSGAEIKVAYELEANTNAFTDAEKTLLSNQSGTNTGDQTDVTGNSGTTDALNSATTVVDVSAATAPTVGQILIATSSTAATWQDASGGLTAPVSSTDNAVVRWDGVGADTVQDTAGVLIDDDGRISQPSLGLSTFLGFEAGLNDDLSNNLNTFIGYAAGKANTSGARNVAVGYRASTSNAGFSDNTALGYNTLATATSSRFCVAVGTSSQVSQQVGDFNVTMGVNSMFLSTAGQFNTAIGHQVISSAQGDNNTALGYFAGSSMLDGDNNTYIGSQAGNGAAGIRSNNIVLGANSGTTMSTGSSNILIGIGVVLPTATTSNYMSIQDVLYGDLTNGNLGLGTTDYASGVGVMAMVNATAPSATPVGGGVLYVEAGALKYKGTSGTITTLGVA